MISPFSKSWKSASSVILIPRHYFKFGATSSSTVRRLTSISLKQRRHRSVSHAAGHRPDREKRHSSQRLFGGQRSSFWIFFSLNSKRPSISYKGIFLFFNKYIYFHKKRLNSSGHLSWITGYVRPPIRPSVPPSRDKEPARQALNPASWSVWLASQPSEAL